MQLYTSLTSIEPLSWTYCSMRTLVEESIRKGRVLVDNVAHERFEFCVDNLAIATVVSMPHSSRGDSHMV